MRPTLCSNVFPIRQSTRWHRRTSVAVPLTRGWPSWVTALDALREKASMPTFIADGARGLALAARRVADAAPSMPRPSLSRRLAGKRMSRPVPSVSLSRRDLRFFNAFPRLRINHYEGVIRATNLRDRAHELFRR